MDATVGDGLAELVAEQALAADVLGLADVERIRLELLEAEARRLQPHYVRAWFADTFSRLGGRMLEREYGRFEITRVPPALRRDGVADRYERVTFDKERARPEGLPPAELLAPGHVLVEAVLALTLDQLGALLRRGAVLVDEADPGQDTRVVVFLEHAIADGRDTATGRNVVSRRFEFVELRPDGSATTAGYAPYLDHRPVTSEEADLLGSVLGDPWLRSGVEQAAFAHAVQVAVPAHLAEVWDWTVQRVANVRAKVRDRLSKQPTNWDPATDGRVTIWEVTQHLVRLMDTDGEEAAADLLGRCGRWADSARDLAQWLAAAALDTRPAEALVHDALITSWSELQRLADRPRDGQVESGL